MRYRGYRSAILVTAIFYMFSLFLALPMKVSAQPLNNRSITIGSSRTSATTSHRFSFDINTVSSVGSIEFEYCTNTPFEGTPCTAPVGLNVLGTNLASQTGETGFSIDASTTANRLVIGRVASLTTAGTKTYRFTNIVNQLAEESVFVRISTFASVDGTGARTDAGGVVYATTSQLSVTAFVPPYLTFCTGITVALNCSSSSGVYLNFGELSKQQPNIAASQFSVATNDPLGYATTITGTTMTSGTNIIPALPSPTVSKPGQSQFGMNLRSNSNPAVGSNPAGVGTGTINSVYNQPNRFSFGTSTLASSNIPSNFRRYTASYLVNVSNGQKPGIYTTTLTYIAMAAF